MTWSGPVRTGERATPTGLEPVGVAPAPDGIRLADDLVLPVELAGGRVAVLGRTGTGKSSTSRRFVEEASRLGRTVFVIDIMGQWRGILEARDGGTGLPFLIAGDEEDDDLDLDQPGRVIRAANAGASVVVDLSGLRGTALARKVAVLLDDLFAEAGPVPILVVLEEADELAPQNPTYPGQRDSTLAVERLARRGRSRGIGLLVITQRSAAIAKGVISQIDVLIAFGSPAPQDRKAIGSWIPTDLGPGAREQLARLGSLAVGEALVWQPALVELSRHRMAQPWTAEHGQSSAFAGRVVPSDGSEPASPVRVLPNDAASFDGIGSGPVEVSDPAEPVRADGTFPVASVLGTDELDRIADALAERLLPRLVELVAADLEPVGGPVTDGQMADAGLPLALTAPGPTPDTVPAPAPEQDRALPADHEAILGLLAERGPLPVAAVEELMVGRGGSLEAVVQLCQDGLIDVNEGQVVPRRCAAVRDVSDAGCSSSSL